MENNNLLGTAIAAGIGLAVIGATSKIVKKVVTKSKSSKKNERGYYYERFKY